MIICLMPLQKNAALYVKYIYTIYTYLQIKFTSCVRYDSYIKAILPEREVFNKLSPFCISKVHEILVYSKSFPLFKLQ